MNRIRALMGREIRAATRSPVALAVIGVYLALHGLFFAQLMEEFSRTSFQAIASGQSRPEHNLVDMVVRPLMMADSFLLLMLLPALTMRQLAEEWKQGTSDLLLSYPVRDREIVLGKFLAAAALVLVLLLLGGAYPASAALLGRLEFGVLGLSLLGMFFYGAAVLAVGLFFSALTENQVIALVSTVLMLLFLTVMGWWGLQVSEPWSHLLRHVSLATHAEPFSYGLLRLSDCVFFVSLTAFFLYLSVGVLEGKRWRRGGRR